MCELVLEEGISWSKSGVFLIWFCSSSLEGERKDLDRSGVRVMYRDGGDVLYKIHYSTSY